MSLSASILPEFDMEMAKTRTTLERVPVEKFDWKPHEKSFSFMEIVNHLARRAGMGSSDAHDRLHGHRSGKRGVRPTSPCGNSQRKSSRCSIGVWLSSGVRWRELPTLIS